MPRPKTGHDSLSSDTNPTSENSRLTNFKLSHYPQASVEDVERAAQRATLLGRTGLLAIPVVAGKTVTEAAARPARPLLV